MADMTTLEVLRGMRELLSEPSRWATGWWARNADGTTQNEPESPEACSWCLRGAAWRIGGEAIERNVIDPLLGAIAGIQSPFNMSHWNDAPKRTHAEVLELLDRAIAAAAKDQPDGK